MTYQLRKEIPGHAVDSRLYTLWSIPNKGQPGYNTWQLWRQISDPFRPPPPDDDEDEPVNEEAELGSSYQILGGGGMAASTVSKYFINPGQHDSDNLQDKLEKLVEKCRAERWRQLDIMDRALHDLEYREKRPFLERQDEIRDALQQVGSLAALIRTVAQYSPSRRSYYILERAEVFIHSDHDITFPAIPKPIES
jgi:hypothetical protein